MAVRSGLPEREAGSNFTAVFDYAATATPTTAHIRLDERGAAWIDDTHTKDIEVALDMIAHGWSPEEIHFQHPHLSLAQVHAGLGYYYDHKEEIDAQTRFRAICANIRSGGPKPGRLRCANGCANSASCRERRPLHGCPCAQRHHSRAVPARRGCPDRSGGRDDPVGRPGLWRLAAVR